MPDTVIKLWNGVGNADFVGENVFESVPETIALKEQGTNESIFDAVLSSQGTGLTNFSERMLFDETALTPTGDSNRIRVQFSSPTASPASILRAYVGHRASSGNPYDFDGNQVELTFSGGGSGFSIGNNTMIWSDDIEFAFDEDKDLIISYDFGTVNPNIAVNAGIPETVTPYRSTTGGGTPGEAPDSIPASVYSIVGGDTTRVHSVSEIELLVSYPAGGVIPTEIWMSFPVGTTLFSDDARVPEDNNPGDAGTLKYKYKTNNGVFGSLLTQADFRNEFPLGLEITDPVNSISVVGEYTSDGSQKTTTRAFMTLPYTCPTATGGGTKTKYHKVFGPQLGGFNNG